MRVENPVLRILRSVEGLGKTGQLERVRRSVEEGLHVKEGALKNRTLAELEW